MRRKNIASLPMLRLEAGSLAARKDAVAVEEPLEIRIGDRSVAVTMRTPGDDFDLAAGFLFTENVISHPADIRAMSYCSVRPQEYNVLRVELARNVEFDPQKLERHFFTTSACGVCGRAALESIRVRAGPIQGDFQVPATVLFGLEGTLRQAQPLFVRTGALHAAALFDGEGRLLLLREDVGRHNAVDKLIGACFLAGRIPLDRCLLLVSGRSSFEIMQKALVARIPLVVSIGGPSSLAVDIAREFGMTLVSFLRDNRCNIYAGRERVRTEPPHRGAGS